ncbi:MAG TPA: YIP1 family protein [Vicinamibacterales bacterium]
MTEFGAPPGSFPPPVPPPPPTAGARTGPPWEGTGPAVQRFIDTAKGVLLDPTTTFRNLRREGGLGGPVTYYLIGTLLSVVAQSVWQLAGLGSGFEQYGYGGGFLSSLILGAVAVLAGLFIGSGIVHLFLMLLGGARFPFEATLRTLAYAHGSAAPIGIVPFCGGFVAMIWGIIAAIIGLAQVHETSTGKAAGAVLIPFVLCCALLAIFATAGVLAMLGIAAAANR